MVHVIFAEVVFWKIRDVGLLDLWNVRRVQNSDIHDRVVLSKVTSASRRTTNCGSEVAQRWTWTRELHEVLRLRCPIGQLKLAGMDLGIKRR